MTHRLYMDVHVASAVTAGLRRRGIDVLTAQDDGNDESDDELLLARATQLGRVIFTQDEDFLRIAAAWQTLGTSFAGVVYGHQQLTAVGTLVRDLEMIAQCTTDDELRDRVTYLPFKRAH